MKKTILFVSLGIIFLFFVLSCSSTPKQVTSISIGSEPYKVFYSEGQKLNLTGLTVWARYSDGTTDYDVEGYTTTPAEGEAVTGAGLTSVYVQYKGKTTRFYINVH